MNKFRNNQKGFTLVELLIVVAIIGILAAIAIPMFVQYKRGAVESKVEANLVTCITLLSAKFTDNGTTAMNCDLSGQGDIQALAINGTTGVITPATTTQITTDGYTVDCWITSNATTDVTDVNCNAT